MTGFPDFMGKVVGVVDSLHHPALALRFPLPN